jgi:hypothetical protein
MSNGTPVEFVHSVHCICKLAAAPRARYENRFIGFPAPWLWAWLLRCVSTMHTNLAQGTLPNDDRKRSRSPSLHPRTRRESLECGSGSNA